MQIPLKKKSVKSVKPIRKKSKPKNKSPAQLPPPIAQVLVPQYTLTVKPIQFVFTLQDNIRGCLIVFGFVLGLGLIIAAMTNFFHSSGFKDGLFYGGMACWCVAYFYAVLSSSDETKKLYFSHDWCAVGGKARAWSELRVRLRLKNSMDLSVEQLELMEHAQLLIKTPDAQEFRFELPDARNQIEALEKFLHCAPAGSLAKFTEADHAEFSQRINDKITEVSTIRLGSRKYSNARDLALLAAMFGLVAVFCCFVLFVIAPLIPAEYQSISCVILMLGFQLSLMVWGDYHFYTDKLQINQAGFRSKMYGDVCWAQLVSTTFNKGSKSSSVTVLVREADGQERQLIWSSGLNQTKMQRFAELCQSNASLAYA